MYEDITNFFISYMMECFFDDKYLSLPPFITSTIFILLNALVLSKTSIIFLNNFDFMAELIECINKGLFYK